MPFLAALPTVDPQSVVDGAALWNNGFKNYLINGDFAINQRVFAGGALAAGVYGFDRWKAGVGGCSVSLSAGVLTHTSGPLVQVIEAPNLAGKTITVSVDALSGGNLTATVEGVSGTILAAAGRTGVSLVVPGTSTGNVTVTLTPAAGAVTYKRVQVELGSVATAFEWRPAHTELSLCQRYFFQINGISGGYKKFAIGTAANATLSGSCSSSWPVTMTGPPSVSLPNASLYNGVAISPLTSFGISYTDKNGFAQDCSASSASFTAGQDIAVLINSGSYMSADAEL